MNTVMIRAAALAVAAATGPAAAQEYRLAAHANGVVAGIDVESVRGDSRARTFSAMMFMAVPRLPEDHLGVDFSANCERATLSRLRSVSYSIMHNPVGAASPSVPGGSAVTAALTAAVCRQTWPASTQPPLDVFEFQSFAYSLLLEE